MLLLTLKVLGIWGLFPCESKAGIQFHFQKDNEIILFLTISLPILWKEIPAITVSPYLWGREPPWLLCSWILLTSLYNVIISEIRSCTYLSLEMFSLIALGALNSPPPPALFSEQLGNLQSFPSVTSGN